MQKISRTQHYRSSASLYGGLIDLILCLPLQLKNSTVIEVGSYIGESANIFSLFFRRVVCVDPHEDASVRELFLLNTSGRNVEIINKTSDEVAAGAVRDFFGLAYVDALHDRENARKDILNYYTLVMDDGYIGGHDYFVEDIKEIEGVRLAVNDLFGEPDFIFSDSSWLVKKTPGRIRHETK
jgi:hypothetical protein